MKIQILFRQVNICEEFALVERAIGRVVALKTKDIRIDKMEAGLMPDIFMSRACKMNAVVLKGSREVGSGEPLYIYPDTSVEVDRSPPSGS